MHGNGSAAESVMHGNGSARLYTQVGKNPSWVMEQLSAPSLWSVACRLNDSVCIVCVGEKKKLAARTLHSPRSFRGLAVDLSVGVSPPRPNRIVPIFFDWRLVVSKK